MLAIVYGVQQAAGDGLTVPDLAAVIVGAAIGVLLIRRQRSLPNPLTDLRLFRIPLVRMALAANTVRSWRRSWSPAAWHRYSSAPVCCRWGSHR